MTIEDAIKRIKWFIECDENHCGSNIIQVHGRTYYFVSKDDIKAFGAAIDALEIVSRAEFRIREKVRNK